MALTVEQVADRLIDEIQVMTGRKVKNPQQTFAELQMDSMDMEELGQIVEDEFQVTLLLKRLQANQVQHLAELIVHHAPK